MAGLHFDITGNNSDFLRKLEETRQGVSRTSKRIEAEGNSIEAYFNKLAKGAAALGLGFSATQLINDIIRVRGEFQQLEISFETMLKSKDKASALMGQLTETAAKTPHDLQGVANGAKQLLAYGTAAEDVNDTLVRLGNIASGLSIPLGDLVYLYGTTQTQGRLFTQDVRQFMGRGIPLVKELAAELGKTEQQINEMVTDGKIGFPEVEKVIRNMTDADGQFYNLMEKQSASLTGQISNLGDAWDMMLNKVGTQTQDIASAGISAVTSLVENYEEVGVALASLVASYGTYKAAIIVTNMLEKANIMILRQAIIEKRLAAAANITLSNSMAVAAARGKMFALVQKNIVSSLKGIGKTLANPYVLLGAAVGAATYGLYKFYTRETEVEQMQRQYNETKKAAIKHEEEHKAKVDELISSIEDETTAEINRVGSMEILKQLYPGIIEKYIDEEGHLRNIIALKKELAEFDATKKVEQNKTELQSYDERIKNQEEYIERMRTSDQSAFNDEIAKLNEMKRQREVARVNVASDYISQSIKKASSLSDEELTKTIDAYQKALSENKNGEWFDTGKEFKVEDINRYISALKNLQTTRANAIHDKEYWENQKKEAETALFALSDVEAAGNKGLVLKNKIAEYDKKINSFSTNATNQESIADKIRFEQEKLKEIQTKNAKDLARQLEDLYFDAEQARINALDDGSKKNLEQMELNQEKELIAIDREKQELIQAKINAAKAEFDAEENVKAAKNPNYKKRTFDSSGIVLSDSENVLFDNKYKAALDRQAKERQAYYNSEKQAMNEYLAAYGTYIEKRNAIIAQGEEKKKGKNEWEQKSIDEETKRTLSDLDIEANKKTSAISKLFDDMRERTVSDMRIIAEEAEKAFQFLHSGEWDDKKGLEFGITKETFDTLRKSPEELEKIRKGIEEINNEADQADTAFNKMAIGLKKVFESGSNSKKFKEGLSDIQGGMNEIMQVGSFLSDTFSNLGETFGSDVLSGIADGINVAMDAASSAMSGAQAGAMFGPWGAAAGAAIGLVSSLGASIAKLHDAKHEKKIQKLQDQIEILEKNYEKLGDSVEKAYSKDASKLISQQNTLLEQQKVLIQQQIREEKDKKKTDNDRIKEWENQIEEINKLIEDNKEKAVDAIFGEDLKSAIDNFAEAYADAWTSSGDRAKSAKDTVRNMMRQMVTESIKAAIESSSKMEEIRKKLQEFYTDNVLSGWEQDYIYNMAEKLQKELDSKYGWADGLMKDETSTSQSSTSKGFGAMSQDSADELNGRFTALQVAGEEIKNQAITQTSILQMIYGLVSGIIIPTPIGVAKSEAPQILTGNDTSSPIPDNSAVVTQLVTLNQVTNSLLGVNQSGFDSLIRQAVLANGYLEDISSYTKKILEVFGLKIDEINRNLKNAL